ncbi:FCD domain-containing protein, partial [Candidatus Aerophobetes bacterium]|nr:FCD domain-containing protein [Candidatus Aerophobetes bacterium]
IGITAAKRAKEKDLEKMEEYLKLQEKAIADKDIEAFNEGDLDFHQVIVTATGNEILIALYKGLTDLMLESRRKTNQLPGVPEEAFNEHIEIFHAIKKGSEEKVQQAIFHHLSKTRGNFEKIFKDAEERR